MKSRSLILGIIIIYASSSFDAELDEDWDATTGGVKWMCIKDIESGVLLYLHFLLWFFLALEKRRGRDEDDIGRRELKEEHEAGGRKRGKCLPFRSGEKREVRQVKERDTSEGIHVKDMYKMILREKCSRLILLEQNLGHNIKGSNCYPPSLSRTSTIQSHCILSSVKFIQLQHQGLTNNNDCNTYSEGKDFHSVG